MVRVNWWFAFHSPIAFEQALHLGDISNVLNLYLKRIFLDYLLICNVFNLLCNMFSVFIFIYISALFILSLNYYAHFSFYFLLTFTCCHALLNIFAWKRRVINFLLYLYMYISWKAMVYYQCCVLIGWATTRLYVIAQ